MSDFNGTKGPWQLGNETQDGDIRVLDQNGAMVASVEAKTGDGYQWSPPTIADNANLIAAAPELLEALQRLVYADCHSVRNSTVHIAALEKASDAIAKALGQ